jgi:putative nucleotidyltransferase with HDIG domain
MRRSVKNILVIDDDEPLRALLRDFLGDMNYRVEEAQNGKDALTLLKNNGKIDLVFLDIRLPDITGIELLPEILSLSPTLPVVMITGYPTVEIAIEAMKKGAADFIVKPLKLDQLNLAINRLLNRRDNESSAAKAKSKGNVKESRKLEQLNQQLNKKIKELNILYSISDMMNSIKDIEELFGKLVDFACEIVEARKAYFMILGRDSGEIEIKAAKGLDQEICQNNRFIFPKNILEEVVNTGYPLLIDNPIKYPLPSSLAGKSVVSVLLSIKDRPFGILNVVDKLDGTLFSEEEVFLLHTLVQKAALNIENSFLYEGIFQNIGETLKALVQVLEAKDPYTKAHSQRVTQLSLGIADEMGCPQEDKDTIKFAGYLHDIGKVGIRDSILMKPGRLTPEEYDTIKTHPIIGERILLPLGLLPQERDLIRHHHERWDGKGYPDMLSGDQIPYLALILAVADVYDAMTSDRPYRPAKSAAEALKEVQAESGTHFNKEVVKAFMNRLRRPSR